MQKSTFEAGFASVEYTPTPGLKLQGQIRLCSHRKSHCRRQLRNLAHSKSNN